MRKMNKMVEIDGLAEKTLKQFLNGVDCFVEFATDINLPFIEETIKEEINENVERNINQKVYNN